MMRAIILGASITLLALVPAIAQTSNFVELVGGGEDAATDTLTMQGYEVVEGVGGDGGLYSIYWTNEVSGACIVVETKAGKVVSVMDAQHPGCVSSAAPAQDEPIPDGRRTAFCIGEVAGDYDTRPQYVTLGEPEPQTDGTLWITGSVDKGNEGIKDFACIFRADGTFDNVMALTGDGE